MFRPTLLLMFLTLSPPLVVAAPIPPPRPARPVKLTQARLVGTWVLHWGAARYTVCLSADGGYNCHTLGLSYTGSWGVTDDGRFWFMESCRPQEAHAWHRFSVKLSPKTLSGRLDGNSEVPIRLERPSAVVTVEGGR